MAKQAEYLLLQHSSENSIYRKLMAALGDHKPEFARFEKAQFINKLWTLNSQDFNSTVNERFNNIFQLDALAAHHYYILPDGGSSYSYLQIDTGRGMLREVSCFDLKRHFVAAISYLESSDKFTCTLELYEQDNYTVKNIRTADLDENNVTAKVAKDAFNRAERFLLGKIACHHKN
jgi:hypothetical protein